MIKLIVAGSRTFNDFVLLKTKLDILLQKYNPEDLEIISGGAKGADALGEKYAQERGISLVVMPADWDKFGKSAGYKRNEEMAKCATHCVVFRVNMSKGSTHMINLAKKYQLKLRVIDQTT